MSSTPPYLCSPSTSPNSTPRTGRSSSAKVVARLPIDAVQPLLDALRPARRPSA
ncbi:MAG: hypothetical protein U0797_19320 [Gemmataceae bacterium]